MSESPSDQLDANVPERLGQYVILDRLGSGGMGTVYRALHQRLQRTVAIKVLTAKSTASPEAIQRFSREMEVIGKLDHPQIVRAIDAGEVGGIHYLAMDYIDGWNLGQFLRKHGPLRLADAAEVVRQTALGLQCLYELGLVHRDIKLTNLMLTRDGQVKILDLGLACLQRQDLIGDELTGTGYILGTADYIAPEQARETRLVDIRADIYSLGCTLYALLTGMPPYSGPGHGDVRSKIRAHVEAEFPPLPGDEPEEFRQVLRRMVAKAPEDRYATPLALIASLEPWRRGADLARLARGSGTQVLPGELSPNGPDSISAGTTVVAAESTRRLTEQIWTHRAPWIAVVALLVVGLAWPWTSAWFLPRPAASGATTAGDPKPPDQLVPDLNSGMVKSKPPVGQASNLPGLTVRELSWPKEFKSSTWEILEGGEELRFFCEAEGLLQFVDVPEDDYRFSVEIRRPEWSGHVGAFLSLHRAEHVLDGRNSWLQTLQLMRLPGVHEMQLARTSFIYPQGHLNQLMETPLTRTSVNVVFHAPYRVEWEVQDGLLREVRLNDRPIRDVIEMPHLVIDLNAEHAAGKVGLFVSRGSGVLRNAVLNGQPMRWLESSEP